MTPTANTIVKEVERLGIHLWREGDRLKYRAAAGRLTDQLRARIAEHRAEILRLLENAVLDSCDNATRDTTHEPPVFQAGFVNSEPKKTPDPAHRGDAWEPEGALPAGWPDFPLTDAVATVTDFIPFDAGAGHAYLPDFLDLMHDADRREYLSSRPRPPRCDWCFRRGQHATTCITRCWPVTLPFGRHRGQAVADVPAAYLRWLLSSGAELSGELRGEIELVLKHRIPPRDP